jgi:hypothetical protein
MSYTRPGFFSSLVKESKYVKSVNYCLYIKENHNLPGKDWTRIYTLREYRLSWNVDTYGKFIAWQSAQLLSTTKIFNGNDNFDYCRPLWQNGKIVGITIEENVTKDNFFLKNQDEMDFEF